MTVIELRQSDEARDFVLQSLLLQRVSGVATGEVLNVVSWALELIDTGDPCPPLGFIGDVGALVFQHHPAISRGEASASGPLSAQQILPPGLIRSYEDHVLGKLYVDTSFERAADAICQFDGRDRARGLRFLIARIRARCGFGGVTFSPAVLRSMLSEVPAQLLEEAAASVRRNGPMPLLENAFREIVRQVRNCHALLGTEDLFELELGTAVAESGQQLALRQVLQAAAQFTDRLPPQPAAPLQRHQDVITPIQDEDLYPIGGYTSISNKGSIESLLHSQLAYIDPGDRPDLFDVKFLRDELFYYARDENQFYRQRRTFVLALFPELSQLRVKDPRLPWQRSILLLSLILTGIRTILEWLSGDELRFELVFVNPSGSGTLEAVGLRDQEGALLELLLHEQIANGTVTLRTATADALESMAHDHAQRSRCHLLTLGTADHPLNPPNTLVESLRFPADSAPVLIIDDESLQSDETTTPLDAWTEQLHRLLHAWV